MRVRIDADKIIAVIIALGFISVTVVLPMVMTREKTKTYEILSDDDFRKYKFEGEGTAENPYIIENLSTVEGINRAITIKNTNSYFIIRNNFFAYNLYNGILIESVAPGTAKIYNNTCIGHSIEGIRIVSSDYVEVYNNTCLDNKIGIGVYDSNNCSIENNQLFKSQPITGKDPAYFSGLILENSNSTSVINNFIKNTAKGVEVLGSNNCTFLGNYITRIFTVGFLFLSSSFCIVEDIDIVLGTHDAFSLRNSHYNIIRNCRISDNSKGMYLFESDKNNISLNSIYENLIGLYITGESQENIINLNEFNNNTEEGIEIKSGEFNIIYHNSFYYNNEGEISQARDDGTDNRWFDDVTSEGNYWSGWNSSLPYEISGNANNSDPFPLSNPVTFSYISKTVFENEVILTELQTTNLFFKLQKYF